MGLRFTLSPRILKHTRTHHGTLCLQTSRSHLHMHAFTPVHTKTHFYGRRYMGLSCTQTTRDLTCAPEFISTAFVYLVICF